MSESKVPMPEPALIGGIGDYREHYSTEAIHSYGDARAAEARRLALMEAADFVEGRAGPIRTGAYDALVATADRLRALADNAKLSGPNGPQERQR